MIRNLCLTATAMLLSCWTVSAAAYSWTEGVDVAELSSFGCCPTILPAGVDTLHGGVDLNGADVFAFTNLVPGSTYDLTVSYRLASTSRLSVGDDGFLLAVMGPNAGNSFMPTLTFTGLVADGSGQAQHSAALFGGDTQAVFYTFELSNFSQVVPVPAALWLFGSALALLSWTRRTAR